MRCQRRGLYIINYIIFILFREHKSSMFWACHRGLCFVDEYTSERVQFVLLSVLSSSMADRGFESQSGQTKDYKIGICCFSASQLVTSITEEYIDIPEIRVMCENGVTCLLAD